MAQPLGTWGLVGALVASGIAVAAALLVTLCLRGRSSCGGADADPSELGPGGFVRLLHQQYSSADAAQWPPEWRALSAMWRQHHPHWRYRFWTDDDEARLFAEALPEFQSLYQALPACKAAPIVRADLSSYAILYVHGGVYADLDTAPLVSLDRIISAAVRAAEQSPAVVVNIARSEQNEEEVRGYGSLEYPFSTDNDLMIAAQPRHPFFYGVLRSIADFVVAHNKTLCGPENSAPNYDLMYISAWGRLSLCTRAWRGSRMDGDGLRFLESAYLQDREEGSFILAMMHVLSSLSVDFLRNSSMPKSKRKLRAWVQRMVQHQDRGRDLESQQKVVSLDLTNGTLPVPREHEGKGAFKAMMLAPDLLVLPIAVSPASLPKAKLRSLLLECASAMNPQSCFADNITEALRAEFPLVADEAVLAVFNQDEGIWEGSWNADKRAIFADALHQVPGALGRAFV